MLNLSITSNSVDTVYEALERDGVVMLPKLLDSEALAGLQTSFERVLERPAFNTWYGYEQNEKWRLLVENALTIDPAVVRLALHPLLKEVLNRYIGANFALTEARGWRTIRTHSDFHGWHNDAWYEETELAQDQLRPREIKLAIYLTDVDTGYFSYIAGSHTTAAEPRHWRPSEVAPLLHRRRDMRGPAGTAFLFDTAGIHRQTTPVLQPRNVLFLNFHDPATKIQALDRRYGRYRPLLLNAAFLPAMDDDDRRILGFGAAASRPVADCVVGRAEVRRYPWLHNSVTLALAARLELQELQRQALRISGALRRRLFRPFRPAPKPVTSQPAH
jgi:hypothetical protein